MHRSRLAGFIIDCSSDSELESAATFWGSALGMSVLGADGTGYIRLDGAPRDLVVEVQTVDHPSRVHLDVEADDVEAEVRRLERLGAKRIQHVRSFWVMEAPTGQRFCVVRAAVDLTTAAGARAWE